MQRSSLAVYRLVYEYRTYYENHWHGVTLLILGTPAEPPKIVGRYPAHAEKLKFNQCHRLSRDGRDNGRWRKVLLDWARNGRSLSRNHNDPLS